MIIDEVDQSFAELLHRSASSLRGMNIYDLTHPDDLPTNRRLLDSLRNDGRSFAITKRYVRGDGAVVWVRNGVSRSSGQGSTTQIIATVEAIRSPIPGANDNLAAIAAKILQVRQARPGIFGADLFGEPVYDLMLDLFVQAQEGRSVSISSACIAARVPATTALRHIAHLVETGWIERVADIDDGRRINVALTTKGHVRVTRFLAECERSYRSLFMPTV